MQRAALGLLVLGVLAMAGSRALAHDRHGDDHDRVRVEQVHHGHYYGVYRPSVVVVPRPYVYAAPAAVVPVYPPPAVVPVYPPPVYAAPPAYYYEQPRSYFQYRGRGVSVGIGL